MQMSIPELADLAKTTFQTALKQLEENPYKSLRDDPTLKTELLVGNAVFTKSLNTMIETADPFGSKDMSVDPVPMLRAIEFAARQDKSEGLHQEGFLARKALEGLDTSLSNKTLAAIDQTKSRILDMNKYPQHLLDSAFNSLKDDYVEEWLHQINMNVEEFLHSPSLNNGSNALVKERDIAKMTLSLVEDIAQLWPSNAGRENVFIDPALSVAENRPVNLKGALELGKEITQPFEFPKDLYENVHVEVSEQIKAQKMQAAVDDVGGEDYTDMSMREAENHGALDYYNPAGL